jgi:superfamily I DNA/RNA helicase
LSPEDYKKAYAGARLVNEFAEIYEKYDYLLERSNALDFDDLLFKTYKLFSSFPEVASYYANKFHYIHIDEFQDTNKVQFALAQALSSKHGNIFVVGDDDQSIYGWRGAKIENILSFDDIYQGAKVYKLERNYRSSKKIIELANAVISHNNLRRKKELWTDNGDGARVETFVGNDENNEATYVALQIKGLMDRSDLKYKDFAVFMRVNAISRAFEQEFTKYGIPYKVFGGFRFFERKEIKDVLSYLKIINNPKDDESFFRSVGSPKRGIGDKTLIELREYAVGRNNSVFEAIELLRQGKSAKEIKAYLERRKDRHSIYIMVSTLKYLKKGGRISAAAAAVGSMLKLKPILSSRGEKFERFAMTMTVAQARKKMIQQIKLELENEFKEEFDAGRVVLSVVHSQNEAEAKSFRDEIEKEIPDVEVRYIDQLSLSVACHIGPGSLAVTLSVDSFKQKG